MSEIPEQRLSPENLQTNIDDSAIRIWKWILTDDDAYRDIIDREAFMLEWMSLQHLDSSPESLAEALLQAEQQIIKEFSNN